MRTRIRVALLPSTIALMVTSGSCRGVRNRLSMSAGAQRSGDPDVSHSVGMGWPHRCVRLPRRVVAGSRRRARSAPQQRSATPRVSSTGQHLRLSLAHPRNILEQVNREEHRSGLAEIGLRVAQCPDEREVRFVPAHLPVELGALRIRVQPVSTYTADYRHVARC